MPLVFPLLLVAGLSAPDGGVPPPPLMAPTEGGPLPNAGPVIPIPTGKTAEPGPTIAVELSSRCLLRFRAWWRSDDETEVHLLPARTAGVWAVKTLAETEETRTTSLTRVGPGPRPQTILYFERFIGNTLAVRREVTDGPAGQQLRVEWRYYPVEGVMLSGGFDTLNADVFGAVQLAF